ncbi:MAG: SUF system NifU family Fe-S cluster assembly protein [Myxococcota bacterium]|jgi:nitrogen fixation NifU-like protein
MDDLRDLYQATILDHNKSPQNFRVLETPNHQAEGHNPLCGDKLSLYLDVDQDGHILDISFQGEGCAISTASASLMTQAVKGKTQTEAEEIFARFHKLLTTEIGQEVDIPDLGKLAVFSGVREYPIRVKCATLAWHTLRAALDDRGETVVTE